eukprot:581252-Pelagomonas_calceolata.AAC.4
MPNGSACTARRCSLPRAGSAGVHAAALTRRAPVQRGERGMETHDLGTNQTILIGYLLFSTRTSHAIFLSTVSQASKKEAN